MTVSSGPSRLIQTGRINWPRVGSSTDDWPAILYMLASSLGESAVRLQKPSSRARCAVRTPRRPPSQAGRSSITWCDFWKAGKLSART